MQIKIISIPVLFNEEAHYFTCENHRLAPRNIVSTLTFLSASGRRLDTREATLTADQYSAWCELGEDDADDPYFTRCHMETLGLEAAPVPPVIPPEPVVPLTPEEIAAQEAAQKAETVADLQTRIQELQAQLDALT